MKTISALCVFLFLAAPFCAPGASGQEGDSMAELKDTEQRLKNHLAELTVKIGERSVAKPLNMAATADYIETFYRDLGISVRKEPYPYHDTTVCNVVAEIVSGENPRKRFLVGAHYDSVAGTVGADDNASAVAVQLETARRLKTVADRENLDLAVAFVSFALEEPPAYGTRHMGSRVYAKKARRSNEKIDAMICLEMVGYACTQPGCQKYPFPLQFFDYPETGDFIGIVGNFKSKKFTRELVKAFEKNPDLPVVQLTVPFNGWVLPSVRLSDHAPFWDNGFKGVMVTDSAFFRNPYYHTKFDTMEKLDYGFMARLVESLLIFFRSHSQ